MKDDRKTVEFACSIKPEDLMWQRIYACFASHLILDEPS